MPQQPFQTVVFTINTVDIIPGVHIRQSPSTYTSPILNKMLLLQYCFKQKEIHEAKTFLQYFTQHS